MATGVEPRPVVMSLHGITTRGKWQKDLVPLLEDGGFRCRLPDYGWYRIIQLLIPFSRARKIKWFIEEYARMTNSGADPPPHVIAHSFGTYIVANAMKENRNVRFDRMILCGSIISRDFNWSDYVANGQINRILNECGRRDWVVRVAEWGIQDAGPSGNTGFTDNAGGKLVEDVHPTYKHSDYWCSLTYTRQWIPFLQGAEPKTLSLPAPKRFNWRFWISRTTVAAGLAIGLYLLYAWSSCRDLPWDAPPGILPHPVIEKAYLPTRARALAKPEFARTDVLTYFTNETGKAIVLFIYACEYSFGGGEKDGDGWYQTYLLSNEAEPIRSPAVHGEHLIFVKAKCDRAPVFCGRVNLYDGRFPTVYIRSRSRGMYEAALSFSSEEVE